MNTRVNPENLPKGHSKLVRKIVNGVILTFTTLGVAAAFGHFSSKEDDSADLISPTTMNVSIDDINQLGVILNDNDCGNSFFKNICSSLEEQGLEFEISDHNDNIQYDNATVITLDQQLSYGEETFLIGPCQDGTASKSEALLKATQVTLANRGWDTQSLAGLQKYATGADSDTVYTKVPSPTEENTPESSSQITIAIGTGGSIFSSEKIAEDVILSLARYQNYLDKESAYIEEEADALAPHMKNDNSYFFNSQINNAKSFDPSVVVSVEKERIHSK